MSKIRSAFTLVELLTVVAIMSMLGVASTAGYYALVRGMEERGVLASVTSVMRVARERARVDHRRVAVYCYNKCLSQPDESTGRDGEYVGVIVAVRPYGRLSAVVGSTLYDEFGDLERVYPDLEDGLGSAKKSGLRLYQMTGSVKQMRYTVVNSVALLDTTTQAYLPSLNATTNVWMGAFEVLRPGVGSPGWKNGDVYGCEFAETTLPRGFVFGSSSSLPSQPGEISFVKGMSFDSNDGADSVEVHSLVRKESIGKAEVRDNDDGSEGV